MSAILFIAAAALPALAWTGDAEVQTPRGPLKIAVRTRIDGDGNVVSESWPVDVGEAKGLRRMTIRAEGGTMERGGDVQPMPADLLAEEQAQFAFYRQLQAAAERAPRAATLGATALSIEGPVRTWFRIGPDGAIIEAFNDMPGENGRPIRQRFVFDGWWRDRGAIFPKRMEMTRDGKPYFTLDVRTFDAD